MDNLTEQIQAIDSFRVAALRHAAGACHRRGPRDPLPPAWCRFVASRSPCGTWPRVPSAKTTGSEGTITPFQALSTALASTVGNGNIGGVATAILIGGPGAIAWMWVCAAVGMATKYAEAVLGVHFRVRRETGELASGPMYYIARGVLIPGVGRPLAYLFAFFGACAALLGTGNMAQSNTVARTFIEAARTVGGVDLPAWVPRTPYYRSRWLRPTRWYSSDCRGGGTPRAEHDRAVPRHDADVVLNIGEVPRVLVLVVSSALSPSAAVGGFVGASLSQVVAAGVSRGGLVKRSGSSAARRLPMASLRSGILPNRAWSASLRSSSTRSSSAR